jgi:hypothetical protein
LLGTGIYFETFLVLLELGVDELLEELDFRADVGDLELLDLSDELETADLHVDTRGSNTRFAG